MIIPPDQLTMDSLKGIIESFIMREGTDYGEVELDIEEKMRRLLPQVIDGQVLIVYDQVSESVNLLSKDEFSEQAKSA